MSNVDDAVIAARCCGTLESQAMAYERIIARVTTKRDELKATLESEMRATAILIGHRNMAEAERDEARSCQAAAVKAFDGGGWGHGVGMCQWGAKGMADAGSNTAQILERYYPGAKIVKEY